MTSLAEQLQLLLFGLDRMASNNSLTPRHVASVVRYGLHEISMMSLDIDPAERSAALTQFRRIIERFHQMNHDSGRILIAISQLNSAQAHDDRSVLAALGFSQRDALVPNVRPHTALRYVNHVA